MGLVYTTLLSLVPLLAVGFSVLKGFGVHNQIEPMLQSALMPLGEKGDEITTHIIGFVDNIKVGILGAVGIALLFYTVVSLIHKIEAALNYTWRITEYRGLAQRISDYLSIIMVGPVLVFAALGITAAITSSSVVTTLSSIEPFGFLIYAIGKLLPYFLIMAAFTFIYILVPNTKVKFRSALTGAVIAGILWQTAGVLFASFVAGSTNYTAVYSSFAILILFMIWLYLSWLILLIGASISFYHQHPERITARQQVLSLSGRLREKVALLIMYRIGKSFHDSETPWTLSSLAAELDISTEALSIVMNSLVHNNLISLSCEEEVSYLPSQSLEHISITSILSAVRAAEEGSNLNPSNIKSEDVIDQLINNIEDSVHNSFSNLSLRDLVTSKTSV
jgi:membrane protein